MFEARDQINSATAVNFFSDEDLIYRAVARLQEAGFEVLQARSMREKLAFVVQFGLTVRW